MGETTTNAVLKYKPMIRAIAARLSAKLPSGVLLDDLIQEGMVALILAVRQSKDKGERFTAYAYQRVQGAMLDSLRAIDNAPRSQRQQSRQANATVSSLEQRLGRRPFESEIAAAMGVQLSDYQRLLFDVYASTLLYFDPTDAQYGPVFDVIDAGAEPERDACRRQLVQAIEWAVDALPDLLHSVTIAIYMRGQSAREVSDALFVSEGRVSQIRKESLERIRVELHRQGLVPD